MIYRIICAFVAFLSTIALSAQEEAPAPILVTVPPYQDIVSRLVGPDIPVEVVVPVGVSVHTYEPTPRQMMRLARSDLWFVLGEPFEQKVTQALAGHNSRFRTVDLRQGIELICGAGRHAHCKCHPDGLDLHYWLSPRRVAQQVELISRVLKERYPSRAAAIEERRQGLQRQLQELDGELRGRLSGGQRVIVVAHPALAYYGQEYGLVQLPVEQEGKDPTPRQLAQLLHEARSLGVRYVFLMPQYSSKGAQLVAGQLNAELLTIDPYGADYFAMMRELAQQFAKVSPQTAPTP